MRNAQQKRLKALPRIGVSSLITALRSLGKTVCAARKSLSLHSSLILLSGAQMGLGSICCQAQSMILIWRSPMCCAARITSPTLLCKSKCLKRWAQACLPLRMRLCWLAKKANCQNAWALWAAIAFASVILSLKRLLLCLRDWARLYRLSRLAMLRLC